MGKTPHELALLSTDYVLLFFYFDVNPNQFKNSGNRPISTLSALIMTWVISLNNLTVM